MLTDGKSPCPLVDCKVAYQLPNGRQAIVFYSFKGLTVENLQIVDALDAKNIQGWQQLRAHMHQQGFVSVTFILINTGGTEGLSERLIELSEMHILV